MTDLKNKKSLENWQDIGKWPSFWITGENCSNKEVVVYYKTDFKLTKDITTIIKVTADENYKLYLNGKLILKRNERGTPDSWLYDSLKIKFKKGNNTLIAKVWSLNDKRAISQMSIRHGFLLYAEGTINKKIGTGVGAWKYKEQSGYKFINFELTHWRGARVFLDSRLYDWDIKDWRPAVKTEQATTEIFGYVIYGIHRLQQATLPKMLYKKIKTSKVRFIDDTNIKESGTKKVIFKDNIKNEVSQWQKLLSENKRVIIPPHTNRRIIIDMNDYYCLYPEIVLTGGRNSEIRILSAETLFETQDIINMRKGNRDIIDNKYFIGVGDTFIQDGGKFRKFEPLWWQAGRYWEILIKTDDTPLTINNLNFFETRYPLQSKLEFKSDNENLNDLIPILTRVLQVSSHDIFADAPYYEELMYAADSRIEMLSNYILSSDNRLQKKTIRLFDSSRLSSGLLQARYPSWETQIIGGFSLWWIFMLYDFAHWTNDADYIKKYLSGMRMTLEGYNRLLDENGLLKYIEGWNFIDWVPTWIDGIPKDGLNYNGSMNWSLVYALVRAADLEEKLGDLNFANLYKQRAADLYKKIYKFFYCEKYKMFAENKNKTLFSEHSQILAILSNMLDKNLEFKIINSLLTNNRLAKTTYYFSHYLFEVYRKIRRVDLLFDRLSEWFKLAQYGLKTTVEGPDINTCRSDCHGWSAHPLFHFFATILGIRPGSINFKTVNIAPMLGDLKYVSASMPHPVGKIKIEFENTKKKFSGKISLPKNVTGVFLYNGIEYPLNPLNNTIIVNY